MDELDLSFGNKLQALFQELSTEPVANYYTPKKWIRFWEVLIPENWIYQGIIVEWWHPEGKDEHWESDTILHGHKQGTACRNWHYCHVYGYKPTGAEGPKFIKNFYEKWGYLKDEG